MRLQELKAEIEQSAKSLFGEKSYPITSGWIPVTDVLAIVDRFQKEWNRELEPTLSSTDSLSSQQLRDIAQRIRMNLLD